ncbi:MAG: hypothetical protein LRY55_12385 [Leadbetterella sp.]|nr:hypothetical protein [Leadbetterella sp.]
MKTPYQLHFHVPFEMIPERLPKRFRFRLATATHSHSYRFATAELGVQRLNLRPFYIELFELNTSGPFTFNLEITAPQHFLFLMPEGQVQFSTPEGFYLSYAPEGTWRPVIRTPGTTG